MEINKFIIHYIEIYPVDSLIHLLNKRGQINNYPEDRETTCVTQAEDSEIYSVENVIHPLNNWCLENNIPFLGNDVGFARLKDARTKAEP